MKQYIRCIKMTVVVLITLLLSIDTYAQSDLGVVWQKNDYTLSESTFRNVSAQSDGTYLATGQIFINDVTHGYIVHFREEGETIREYIIPMPVTTTTTVGSPHAALTKSFFMQDGSIIAVGLIFNSGANTNDKGPDFSNNGILNYNLKLGAWFVKLNPQTGIPTINRLDRGTQYADLTYNSNNRNAVITYGVDVDPLFINLNPSDGNIKSLLRVYKQEGTLVHDNQTYPLGQRIVGTDGLEKATILPDGKIFINTNFGGIGVSPTTYTVTQTYNGNVLTCRPTILPPGTSQWPRYGKLSLLNDGSLLAGFPIAFVNSPRKYFGWMMGKITATNTQTVCIVEEQTTEEVPVLRYDNFYPAPGSNVDYMGTFKDVNNISYLAQYTDNGVFPQIIIGDKYPLNTTLSIPSSSDGFFSCGQDAITKRAAIAKLSTCVNFKINNIPTNNEIYVEHAPSISINIPLNFEGAKAAIQANVKYDLLAAVEVGKVGNITPSVNGGQLENLTNQTVTTFTEGGAGLVLNLNKAYDNIADEPLVIKYILTIRDSYMTAGVSQSCGQTYVFYLRSVPQSEVVAMPTSKTETSGATKITASIKNMGDASFANPYNITVYKNAVGDATKFTYSYPKAIARGETVDFEIALPNDTQWNGATNLVLNFNDNGDGSTDQPENDETVKREYKVKQ